MTETAAAGAAAPFALNNLHLDEEDRQTGRQAGRQAGQPGYKICMMPGPGDVSSNAVLLPHIPRRLLIAMHVLS